MSRLNLTTFQRATVTKIGEHLRQAAALAPKDPANAAVAAEAAAELLHKLARDFALEEQYQ